MNMQNVEVWSLLYMMEEAVGLMGVEYAYGLEEGMDGGRADEFHASFSHVG